MSALEVLGRGCSSTGKNRFLLPVVRSLTYNYLVRLEPMIDYPAPAQEKWSFVTASIVGYLVLLHFLFRLNQHLSFTLILWTSVEKRSLIRTKHFRVQES
jgi:hypothetical protein